MYETGDRIREIRKDRGFSQDQLAELSSLNRVTIAKYESGKVEPGAQALYRIADALDVTVDQLLGRADIKQEPKGCRFEPYLGSIRKARDFKQSRAILFARNNIQIISK